VFRLETARSTLARVAAASRFGGAILAVAGAGHEVDGKRVKSATGVATWFRSHSPMDDKEYRTLAVRLRRRAGLHRLLVAFPRIADLDIGWSAYEKHYGQIMDYLTGTLVLRGVAVPGPSADIVAFWQTSAADACGGGGGGP
jgi:hypothetical protein